VALSAKRANRKKIGAVGPTTAAETQISHRAPTAAKARKTVMRRKKQAHDKYVRIRLIIISFFV
jgi:hypothetical protein